MEVHGKQFFLSCARRQVLCCSSNWYVNNLTALTDQTSSLPSCVIPCLDVTYVSSIQLCMQWREQLVVTGRERSVNSVTQLSASSFSDRELPS